MTDTTIRPVQRLMREYRTKHAAHIRAVHVYGQLTEDAERSGDYNKADTFYDERYVPVMAEAFEAAEKLLGRLEELTKDVEAALSDAWRYRLGEAYNMDDENDLSEHDRQALKTYDALATQLGMKIG